MSDRRTGQYAQVKSEVSFLTRTKHALTPEADNKTFDSGQELWKRNPKPNILVSGIRGGCSVNPTANVDEVQVGSGAMNFDGVQSNVSADASVTVSRPVSGSNVIVNAIVIDSAGAITNLAGAEGTDGGARGAVGGPPLIPVDRLLIAEVKLGDAASAVVATGEINTSVMERADRPSYDIDYINGKIVFSRALETIHTGTVPRTVYAGYDFSLLEVIGHMDDWALSGATNVADATVYGDADQINLGGVKSWNVTATRLQVNSYWFDQWRKSDTDLVVLDLYVHKDDAEFERGQGIMASWELNPPKDNVVKENISVTGSGPIVRKIV